MAVVDQGRHATETIRRTESTVVAVVGTVGSATEVAASDDVEQVAE